MGFCIVRNIQNIQPGSLITWMQVIALVVVLTEVLLVNLLSTQRRKTRSLRGFITNLY
jgi:hypothetical protein